MSVLRNDLQVALNDLHVALQESADHYRYAAELITEPLIGETFNTLAESRAQLAHKTAQAIRDNDDLPSVPDTDSETGEQLLQRLEAALSINEAADIVAQRLEGEVHLEQLLQTPELGIIDKKYSALHEACLKSVKHAQEQLSGIADA
jgi:predicted trehalose synthase